MGIGILIVFVVSLVYKGRKKIQKALAEYKNKETKKNQLMEHDCSNTCNQ